MKKLFKISVSKVYVMYLLLLTIFVIGTYSSYAYFTVNKEKKNAIKMITGNLIGELKVDDVVSDKLVVNANETKTFKVEIYNKNNRQARFNFYYKGALPDNVEAGYVEGDGYNTMTKETGVNLTANGTLGYFLKYQIRVVNNTSNTVTIPIGYSVGLDYNDLSLSENHYLFEKAKLDPAVDILLENYTNSEDVQDYDVGYTKTDKTAKENKMYVFNHKDNKGTQQSDWSDDELKDYRYIGADPNNYVTFNDEEAGWRIVGIFTVENENGKKEKRIKIVRTKEIGNFSWDNRNIETGAEDNNGSNDWTTARIMKLLNPNYQNETGGSLYWNRESGFCYSGQNNASVACNFKEIGLTTEARSLIGQTKWYLGAILDYSNAENLYSYERGTNVYQSTINPRKENTISYIALLYPSDFSSATSGGTTVDRISCLSMRSPEWRNNVDCYNNNYLFFSIGTWFLNSWIKGDSPSSYIVDQNKAGFVGATFSYSNHFIFPTFYLKSDVKYQQGDGSKENPFVFTK